MQAYSATTSANIYIHINGVYRRVISKAAGEPIAIEIIEKVAKGDTISFAYGFFRDSTDRVLTLNEASIVYTPPKFSEIAGAKVTTDIGYSLAEQDTGTTWVDGKKIYKRTFKDVALTNSSTPNTEVVVQILPGGIVDTLVKMEGYFVGVTGNVLIIPWTRPDTGKHVCVIKRVYSGTGQIEIQGMSSIANEIFTVTPTIYYTKL
jgi:hypothetical protein